MEKSNILHRPLSQFFYGSLTVIMLALLVGAYYFSDFFIENEKKRAQISSLQVSESLGSEHRYIVEEFFTSSYESVFMRVSSALQKFGAPQFELYLFNEKGDCLLSRKSDLVDIPCASEIKAQDGKFLYATDLKLGANKLGEMKVVVEDRFNFFTGSPVRFISIYFLPIFLSVLGLWALWAVISRKYILIPYYRRMMNLEKEKVSTDIVRQIIHDTKSEIATLDLYTYELEDQQKAEEMRKTLHNIREAFGNLSHHKEGIVTTVREVPMNALGLFNEFVEQQKVKYKRYPTAVSIRSVYTSPISHKIKVDANSLYRVLSNLVENAATAPNSMGWPDIILTYTESQDSVLVSVTDNGNGISEEAQRRLFEKGFTTKENGSGQGLPFVKHTVEGWGGKISYKTRPEDSRGTTFTIEIPSYSKPKVVILDDNISLLYRYKKMIEKHGHEAEVFTETSSLLARSSFFDKETIFLLDFNLSDHTNGGEVGQKLNKLEMSEIFLHTGNPFLEKKDYPFAKDILSKGNFLETISKLGLT